MSKKSYLDRTSESEEMRLGVVAERCGVGRWLVIFVVREIVGWCISWCIFGRRALMAVESALMRDGNACGLEGYVAPCRLLLFVCGVE